MKIIFTFGSSHLQWLHHKLNPMKVALVIDAENEHIARNRVFNSRVGEFFSTSYCYDTNIEKFKAMGMREYSLSELEDFKWEPSSYGVLMAKVGEYLVYHNQYDNNYTINNKSNHTIVKQKITKNQMLDFLNNNTKDSK